MPCCICGAETTKGSNLCAEHKLGGSPTQSLRNDIEHTELEERGTRDGDRDQSETDE